MQQFVREYHAERLRVARTSGLAAFHQRLDLQHGMPETHALKVQPRRKRSDSISSLRVNQRGLRIDMDIGHPRRNIQIAPLAKSTPRRHESERLVKDLTIRLRYPIDHRHPSTACETLMRNQ